MKHTADQFPLPINASSAAPLVLEVEHSADRRPAATQPDLLEMKTEPAKDLDAWLARQPARFRAQIIAHWQAVNYPQRHD